MYLAAAMVTEESLSITATTEKTATEPGPEGEIDRLAKAALRSSGDNPVSKRLETEGPLRGRLLFFLESSL